MGIMPYLPSQVMLQEHQQIIERAMRCHAVEPLPRSARAGRLAATRAAVGSFLRVVADRLDPVEHRPGQVTLIVMSSTGKGKACG